MRTVSVKLAADIADYQRKMTTAGADAKTLKGELDKANDAGKLDGAAEAVGKLGAGLDSASGRARGLGDALGGIDGSGLENAGRHAEALDRKIADTESGMRSLARAFAETGDPKILQAWKEQGQVLGELRNVRKFLPNPAEVAQAGVGMGKKISEGILQSVPPQMSQALVMGAVAGAPFAATAIVGAISGGAALGGIGAGVALALKDPQIKAQAKSVGANLSWQMRSAASAFSEAMPDALGKVQNMISGLQNEFETIFTSSAGYLGPFLDAIQPGIEAIVQGLSKVIEKAGPTLAVIGSGIADIGEQVGYFLDMIAKNSDVGALALDNLFTIITFGLQTLTVAIDFLATAYKYTLGWTSIFSDADDAVDKFGNTEDKTSGSTRALGVEVEETGKKAQQAKNKFVALEEILAKTADRNLSAAEANIAMRQAVSDLADGIDKKRKVTDAETTSLINFARTANSTTKTLDEQGRTVGQATKAHESNRKKLIDTAIQMGYTRTQAKRLADQYLATPKNVTTPIRQPGMPNAQKQAKDYYKALDKIQNEIKTNVSVKGDVAAYAKLKRLLVAQQAASKGISVSAAQSAYNKQEAKAFHAGGYTGPGGKYDPAGTVHADEFVIRKESRQKIERAQPGLLSEMNATGQLPGYATGGRVLNMPFNVNAGMTKIISMAEALSKVTPSFNKNWPSSPMAQRGDSGIWRDVVRMIKATGPLSGEFGNGYRPGDPKWHGSGRAVDWMGYGQDALASYLASKRPLELIHRTNSRDYAYTRGRNKGSFNNALMEAHRNHVHIAMQNGGIINEHVFGMGASGNTYEFGERGPERVMPISGAGGAVGGSVTRVLNVYGPVGSQHELEAWFTQTHDRLAALGRV